MKRIFWNSNEIFNFLSSNVTDHTKLVIWGLVIGVSILMITIFLLIHFLWWKPRCNKIKQSVMKVQNERSFLYEVKNNIFLILASIFVLALGVSLFGIIKTVI